MRQACFTEGWGLNTLGYLCNLIPTDHRLNARFTQAYVMLAARLETRENMRTIRAYVSFYYESEVKDLLELLGYPGEPDVHKPFVEQYIRLAEQIRLDYFKASRNFLGSTNS